MRTSGSVKVDFAGTKEEAREFARQHGREFPRGLTLGRGGGETTPNGDAMLVSRWTNLRHLQEVEKQFEALGWDRGSQERT